MAATNPANAPQTFTIVGFTGCPHFQKTVAAFRDAAANHPQIKLHINEKPHDDYFAWLKKRTQKQGIDHHSSPAVFLNGKLIGGEDVAKAHLVRDFPQTPVIHGK